MGIVGAILSTGAAITKASSFLPYLIRYAINTVVLIPNAKAKPGFAIAHSYN